MNIINMFNFSLLGVHTSVFSVLFSTCLIFKIMICAISPVSMEIQRTGQDKHP